MKLPLSRQACSRAVEQREACRRQAAVETEPCLVDQKTNQLAPVTFLPTDFRAEIGPLLPWHG
jgi:hypothetical protein